MPRYSLSPSRLARYFYFDCPRYLRYFATPRERRPAEGVPAHDPKANPIPAVVLEGGYLWEEEVVGRRLGAQVKVKRIGKRLRDRTFTARETEAWLRKPGRRPWLYQGTLVAPERFYETYGVPSDHIVFSPCRPDLIEAEVHRGTLRKLRVVDVKASEHLKASHRIQVALYAMLLKEVAIQQGLPDDAVDTDEGGIWLYLAPAPERFSLAEPIQMLQHFLSVELLRIFEPPLREVGWHLCYRCEWCEYFHACREEAERTRSVSLLPYLSVSARRFLAEGPFEDGTPVHTLDDLDEALAEPTSEAVLRQCGSLSNQRERLRHALEALQKQQVVPHGGATLALPQGEQVRLVLTLQREPLSGQVYALGFRRQMGQQVYGSGWSEHLFVAESPEQCRAAAREFVQALYQTLETLHRYNAARGRKDWREQRSLQAYVFDSYEAALLTRVLLETLGDEGVGEQALALLFHFHAPDLAASEQHPEATVPYPVVVLTRVLRRLVALPIPVAWPLPEVLRALPSPDFDHRYEARDLFHFELSNALKSDAIFLAWHQGRVEAADWIRKELRRRLLACGAVVDGLRAVVKETLFAWPPKFQMPEVAPFDHPALSRIAFVTRYESFLAALATREQRTPPRDERVRDGIALPLRYLGDQQWEVLGKPDLREIQERVDTFPGFLLSRDDAKGDRAQMRYDDYRNRACTWASSEEVAIAAIRAVSPPTRRQGPRIALRWASKGNALQFRKGDRALLQPRFTDFTADRVVAHLRKLDADPEAPFLELLTDPIGFCREMREPRGVRQAALRLGRTAGLRPSQMAALRHVLDRRFTLVWGPPGTGKTYFLAWAMLCLAEAYREAGQPLRIGVTAFTHAAIENLLAELATLRGRSGRYLPVWKLKKIVTPRGDLLQGQCITETDAPAVLASKETLVAGGTVYSLHKATKGDRAPFDLLVVDEASQMKMGELALGMSALGAGGRLVLAGDHHQLPPIVQGTYPDSGDGRAGLERSCFEYLRDRQDEEAPYTCQLTDDWRMNRTLSAFAAETLYGVRYRPATRAVATRQIRLKKAPWPRIGGEFLETVLDPAFPLVVCIIEQGRTGQENPLEAALVATLATALRARMFQRDKKRTYPETEAGDAAFWQEGLFVVSPHHAQRREILRALERRRAWRSAPFVDTVDKMQGQQAQAVIVSYGVSDPETALREAAFIYSRNRLNVSVTRAQAKCIVFLPRRLFTPPFEVLDEPTAALGLAHMQALVGYVEENGEAWELGLDFAEAASGEWMTVLRC